MQSLRQDCTVQHLHDELTVEVGQGGWGAVLELWDLACVPVSSQSLSLSFKTFVFPV